MKGDVKKVFYRNLWKENPVIRQILGICSSLAVTNLMINTLVMGAGVIFVLAFSGFTISILRSLIPGRIRMIVMTLIIASYVIMVDLILKAYLPDVSKSLGPYVGLIITNCIIMGRAEAFALKNSPVISGLDGIFAGIGYTLVLLSVSFIREILGFGTVFGVSIGVTFDKWTIMVMPPGAFFIIALIIWGGSLIQMKLDLPDKKQKAGASIGGRTVNG